MRSPLPAPVAVLLYGPHGVFASGRWGPWVGAVVYTIHQVDLGHQVVYNPTRSHVINESTISGWWFGTWLDYDFPYLKCSFPGTGRETFGTWDKTGCVPKWSCEWRETWWTNSFFPGMGIIILMVFCVVATPWHTSMGSGSHTGPTGRPVDAMSRRWRVNTRTWFGSRSGFGLTFCCFEDMVLSLWIQTLSEKVLKPS